MCLGRARGHSAGGMRACTFLAWLLLLQEDISRLRRKLEKQRKVEVYADADEILQEEIKEYKVGCGDCWWGLASLWGSTIRRAEGPDCGARLAKHWLYVCHVAGEGLHPVPSS